MAFNFEKECNGKILAQVRGGVLDGQLLRLSPQGYEPRRGFDYIALPDGEFIPYPMLQRERDTYYTVGSSGSGKSYFTKQYAQNYNKVYPSRPVYLFSKVKDDNSLEGIDNLKQVKLEKFTSPVTGAAFYQNMGKDCLVIYDDVDTVGKKEVKASLTQLKSDILEMGRHQNCSFISIAHLGSRGLETRRDLSESQCIVVFPMSLNGSNARMLTSYAGLTTKDVKVIKKKIKSRWVLLHLHVYPQVWVSQRECGLISELATYTAQDLKKINVLGGSVKDFKKEVPKTIKCPCGGSISHNNETRHMKSKRHRKYDAERRDAYWQRLLVHPKDEQFSDDDITIEDKDILDSDVE